MEELEEEGDEDEEGEEDEEEDMTNFSECRVNNAPGRLSFGCQSK